jgi:ATP-dependent Clp protease protease subunit
MLERYTMITNYMPIVVEQDGLHERSFDLSSRLMRDRIIFLNGQVNAHMAHIATMQLLYLESVDPKAPINVYINSEGGSVLAGINIEDVMNSISCPVHTTAMGMAMSMGAYLLAAGTKGERSATEGCRIMCHSVSAGNGGTVHDMKISMRETEYLDDYLAARFAKNCGVSLDKYRADTQRDFYMSAQEAVEYGLIDRVVVKKT